MMVFGNPATAIRRGLAIASTAGALCFATACSDSTNPRDVELKGTPVPIGNGTARTFVVETGSAQPSAIGIELSTTALDGLPADMAQWSLPMPAGLSTPPWDHVMINWNPQGHEPTAIYGLPHFDFHFYTITPDEQMQIAGGPDNTPVPTQNVPQDYSSQVMSVPMMGVHWADTQSPEFHGSTFDRTFIYGFYQGNMVFVEPMVTRAMLTSKPNATAPVKQPQSYQKSGFYPDQYSVRYDAASNTVRITLESLRNRS
jgi:Domain of unknown function (DUF5602)